MAVHTPVHNPVGIAVPAVDDRWTGVWISAVIPLEALQLLG
jgi:hypothetical protein